MTLTLPKNIAKRGRIYTVRYTLPHEHRALLGRKEVVRSLGTSDLAQAVIARDAVIDEIKRSLSEEVRFAKAAPSSRTGCSPSAPKGATIAETARRWLAESDGIAEATKVRYRQHLAALEAFTKNAEVRAINRDTALKFIEHLRANPSERTGEPLSQRSLGSYQTCLASYWRVLEHWGLVDGDMKNPFSSLLRRVAGQRKKVDPRKKELCPVTREEAEQLLEAIANNGPYKYRQEMLVTVRLLWVTACRLNEIASLRLDQITDHGDHIALRITKAKTEAGNRVVMLVGQGDCELIREAIRLAKITPPVEPDNAGLLFPRLLRGGYDRKPGHYLGKALEKARKALPGHEGAWDMHSFRRTGVSALVNAGVAKEARNLAVGHANTHDIGMSVYAKRADLSDVIRATFEALYKELGGSLGCDRK